MLRRCAARNDRVDQGGEHRRFRVRRREDIEVFSDDMCVRKNFSACKCAGISECAQQAASSLAQNDLHFAREHYSQVCQTSGQ